VVTWDFFFVIPPTEPCALRSNQPLKVSTRDFSWGKGSRCVWLTTYYPCSAEMSRNPGSQTTRNSLGHLGLSRETFTLLLVKVRYYKGGRSSAKRTGRLYPRRNSWYSLLEAESTSRHMVLSGVAISSPCGLSTSSTVGIIPK